MKNAAHKSATEYVNEHHRFKRWQKIVTCLAAAVVFITTYALILPAITMEKDTYCGYEEHKHSDSCYEKQLVCGEEEGEGHTHSDSCYENVLVCNKPEHTHRASCHIKPESDKKTLSGEERLLTYAGDDYTITTSVLEEANIPKDAELAVEEITKDSEDYQDYYKKATESIVEQSDEITHTESLGEARFFDISFMVNGKEVEPDAAVDVSIKYSDVDDEGDTPSYYTVHFADDGIEVIDTEAVKTGKDEVELSFTQDSFSVTAIVKEANPKDNPEKLTTVDTRAYGITINLFDYWIGDSSDPGAERNNVSTYDNPRITGINTGKNDKNRDLQFYSYGTQGNTINNYPESQKPSEHIVYNNLGSDGYPRLTTYNFNDNKGSLSYLFDLNNNNNGKKVYSDVNHLFIKDDDGYFTYNSNQSYAYYNSSGDKGDFIVYDGTYRATCEPNKGEDHKGYAVGFFPFNRYNSSQTCVKNFDGHDNNIHNNGNQGGTYYNHHLGMTMEAKFKLPALKTIDGKDIVFSYSGDDDMWVFIDDKLVLDVGGLHEPSGGTINFTTGKIELDFAEGNDTVKTFDQVFGANNWDPTAEHTIKVFYLERGGCYSNLAIEFNIPAIKDGNIEVAKTLKGEQADKYKNDEFQFEIELQGNDGNYAKYNGKAVRVAADGKEQNITISNGEFKLRGGEHLRIEGLDNEQRYKVRELNVSGTKFKQIQESFTGKEISINSSDENAYLETDPIKVKDVHKTEFVNSTLDPPSSVTVEKKWENISLENAPDIQVQLYRKEFEPKQQQENKHNVTVIVKYVEKGRSGGSDTINTNVVEDTMSVSHGGEVKFSVDISPEHLGLNNVHSGITNTYYTGNAYFAPIVIENTIRPWRNGYGKGTYTLSNITSDIVFTVECKTSSWDTPDNRYASYTRLSSSSGNSQPSQPVEMTEKIVIYGSPVTLTNSNDWKYTWNNLPMRDSNGNLYTYYVKEVGLEGYTVKYSSDSPVRATDNSLVYPVNDRGNLTITNTAITYRLPDTGGPGTTGYILGGLAMMLGSLIYVYMMRHRREGRVD